MICLLDSIIISVDDIQFYLSAELNPWVQSCITKATIFSASKVRRHMHGLTKNFFSDL